MVQKKRKSKRLTPRIRHKRIKEKIRECAKNKKNKVVKVPKSVLMTEEEKELQRHIKEQSKIRSENYDHKLANTILNPVQEVNADAVVEVVDARNIEINYNGNAKHYILINKSDLVPSAVVDEWISKLKNENRNVISNLNEVHENNVVLFGNKNVGKTKLNLELKTQLKTVVNSPERTLLNVLTGAIDLNTVYCEKYVQELLTFVDSNDFSIFYNINDFSNVREFLKLLCEKKKLYKKYSVIDYAETSKRVLNDCAMGVIKFFKTVDGRLLFNFNFD